MAFWGKKGANEGEMGEREGRTFTRRGRGWVMLRE